MKHTGKGVLALGLAIALAIVALVGLEPPTKANAEGGAQAAQTQASAKIQSVEPQEVVFEPVMLADFGGQTAQFTITNDDPEGKAWSFSSVGTFTYFTLTPSGGTILKDQSLTFTLTLRKEARPAKAETIDTDVFFTRYPDGFQVPGQQYKGTIPVTIEVLSNDTSITSIATQSISWGKVLKPSDVQVTTSAGTFTMEQMGLTCDAFDKTLEVGDGQTFTVTKLPESTFTIDGDIPDLTVNVRKSVPSLGNWWNATIEEGQSLSAATPKGGYARNPNTSSLSVEGTVEWQDPSTVPTLGQSGQSFPIKFIPSDTAHYLEGQGTARVTVNKRTYQYPSNPSVTSETVTYDGRTHEAKVSRNGSGAVTICYRDQQGLDSYSAPRNAGTYTVFANVAADERGSYAPGSAQGTLTIEPREISMSITPASKVYGQDVSQLKATASGIGGESVTVRELTVLGDGLAKNANAGPYQVRGTSANPNYTIRDATFNIMRATPQLSGTVSAGKGKTGLALGTLTPEGTFVNPYDPSVIVQGKIEWQSPQTTLRSGGGTYGYTFKPTNWENYNEVKGNAYVEATDRTPVDITIDGSLTYVYDGHHHPITAHSAVPGAKMTYEYRQNGRLISGDPIDAGIYNVTIRADVDDNHADYADNQKTVTLSITPAEPKLKGGEGPAASGSGSTLRRYTLSNPFLDLDGKPLEGAIAWDAPETTVQDGQSYKWTFKPQSANYNEVHGSTIVKYVAGEKADTTKLGELLSEAEGLRRDVKASVDGHDVPTTSKWVDQAADKTLEEAIEHATGHLVDADATQQEVDNAVSMLEVAISNFRNSMKSGTMSTGGGAGGGTGGGGGAPSGPDEPEPEPEKKPSTLVLTPSTLKVKPGSEPAIVRTSGDGDGALMAISSNDHIAYVEVRGEELHVFGREEGTAEIHVTRAATEEYDSASATLLVGVEAQPKAASAAQFRLYNPNSGEHLYTTNANEAATLRASGWTDESTANDIALPTWSNTPVYRLYNPNSHEHHYTKRYDEYTALQRIGWKPEGIKFYSDDAEAVPMYRLFNPNAEPAGKAGAAHHYTTSSTEVNELVKAGYQFEGTGWHGLG